MIPMTVAELRLDILARCQSTGTDRVTCYYCERAVAPAECSVVVVTITPKADAAVGTVCRPCTTRRAAEIALLNAEYDHWRLWGARMPERKVM